jgi:uncharacterized membrane protein YcgQ (UPF0703/DUF1980 family)
MRNKSVLFGLAALCCASVTVLLAAVYYKNSRDTAPAAQEAFAAGETVVEIKEKLFIAQTNEIYLNAEDYFGKTIAYEGLFKTEDYGDGILRCFVIRYGPGCCGYDGTAGFEVAWNEDQPWNQPQDDDWVEIRGRLEEYDEDGQNYLRLALAALEVKDQRGAEFVAQ